MKIEIRYGKQNLEVSLPSHADVSVLRKPPMPIIDDVSRAVRQALLPVSVAAAGCSSACILLCDVTRPVPNGIFIRPLIEEIERCGIAQQNITILIATGLHRPNFGEELEYVVGDPAILERVEVLNHYATKDEEHIFLGETSRGTTVGLDRRFLEADLKIATGLIEPHFMAGYSGGRKVVSPGIAHADTIRALHSARFMEHPGTTQCNMEGNPLHLEQLEILALLRDYCGRDMYALNTVITENRELAFINFGEVVSSHLEGVDFAKRYLTLPVNRKYRTVLTSAAGYPLDQTYYQTVKGMVTPLDILDKDSTLVVASDCAEGLGSDDFRQSQRNLLEEGAQNFLTRIVAKPLADIDEWETEMQVKAQRVARLQLYSDGLQGTDRELTCVEMIPSIENALEESIQRSGDPAIAVIPEGPYVVPVYTP